ncbi:hypothetical protein Tco_1325700, partial [Tanacetum coccineum]
MFQDFRYSDTTHLSRSVKVLKLKNLKKDATLKLFKNGMSMSVQKSQVHKMAKLQDGVEIITSILHATTTTTTSRPKARGVVVQEPSEFRITSSSPQASQPSKTKDKVKEIMIEPEVPLKKKDQVSLDEEMERNLKAQLQAELIEEERLTRKKEE